MEKDELNMEPTPYQLWAFLSLWGQKEVSVILLVLHAMDNCQLLDDNPNFELPL